MTRTANRRRCPIWGTPHRTGDETCCTTTYVKKGTAWIRAAVSRVETVAKACGETVTRPADVISDVQTYHDGSDTHGSAPSQGHGDPRGHPRHLERRTGLPTTSRSSYDALGRMESATDARGGVTTTAYTPAGPGPVHPDGHRQPTPAQDDHHREPAWAEPTSVVDANNKRTDLAHDPLGRLTKVWLPGRAKATKTPNLEFGYRVRADGPLAVTTKRLGPNETYITEIGLFDSLYRPVQTQEASLGGQRLVESTGYNDRGLEAHRAGPAYITGAPANELLQLNPGEDRVRTVLSHDALGRVVNEGTWSGDSQLWATVTGYGGNPDGWQVAVTPPRGGTATATISDVHDRTTELRQFHGLTPSGGYDATKYTYTPRGDLATVTGPTGKVWQYGYDLRGREVRHGRPGQGRDDRRLRQQRRRDLVEERTRRRGVDRVRRPRTAEEALVNGQLAAEWAYDTVAKGHLSRQVSTVDGHAVRPRGLRRTATPTRSPTRRRASRRCRAWGRRPGTYVSTVHLQGRRIAATG